MNKLSTKSTKMIPVGRINILNPRVRNAKIFEGIVQNITKVGLKRPITVTPCLSGAVGKDYDLVCGQGRLEAFMVRGQKAIPALVIDANEQRALELSLVENIARRHHSSRELLQGVEILRTQGYDAKTIAEKIGHKPDYVNGILKLLDHGEERLVSAVEAGHIPIMLAIDVAMSPQDEQRAVQDAYENKQLSGQKLMVARRLLETRRDWGKTMVRGKRKTPYHRDETVTAREILRAYKQEVDRKQMVARKAEIVNTRLIFLVEAMRCLMEEDHFTTLLRAENLDTMPRQLAELLTAKGR